MKIDLSTLTEEQQTALLPVLTAMNTQLTEQQAKIAELSAGGASEEVTTLKAELADLKTKLEAATAKPEDKPNSKTGDKGKAEPQGTASELEARLDKVTEQLTALTTERDQAKASENARRLAEVTVEKNFPNLKPENKKAMVTRIAQANPADEATATAAGKAVAEEWRGLGVDIKPIGSDSAAEGKKQPPAPGSQEERIEAVRKQSNKTVAV